MKQKKLLFVGFGDIAARASQRFVADGWAVTGIARSARAVPDGVDYWRGDLADPGILQQIGTAEFDLVVVTLTPSGRQPEDYQRAYLGNSQKLVDLWEQQKSPGLIIYISSSAVYHQNDGEWVDESSPAQPAAATAQVLLDTENLWQNSPLNTCVVRFSGIYGPGRNHLLKQVEAGNGGPREGSSFTNRIHAEDCAGVIHHLGGRWRNGQSLEPLYLASDCQPAPSWEVRSHLAAQLGYPPGHLQETPASARGGNKRCDNRRLLLSGYRFRYPDYQSGFADIINAGSRT